MIKRKSYVIDNKFEHDLKPNFCFRTNFPPDMKILNQKTKELEFLKAKITEKNTQVKEIN